MNFGKMTQLLKNVWKFALDNYFISFFLAAIAFVAVVSVFRLFFSRPTYIYTKVKISQGLWWASTAKPSIWFVKAIKKNDVETDLVGKPVAQILSIRYYPWFGSDQFDVYLTLKLKVSKNKKTGKYNFKRSTIGVASPIELEFPSVQLSATIIDISEKPFQDSFVEKTVTLTKKNAFPWEYDAIQIGDSYNDGENTVFTILDKTATETRTLIDDIYGNYPLGNPDQKKYITVRAKLRLSQVNDQLFLGPEQKMTLGRGISISTNRFTFNDYTIGKIE